MARLFLIPMQPPQNGTGKGTLQDPWRPKYLFELGLDYAISNGRDVALVEIPPFDPARVKGTEGEVRAAEARYAASLNALVGKSDVEEIRDDAVVLTDAEKQRAAVLYGTLPVARNTTGAELLLSLREALRDRQRAGRQVSVDAAVREALRG